MASESQEKPQEEGVVYCVCGDPIDMIQCEKCLHWQDRSCVGVTNDVPPVSYICRFCCPGERVTGRTTQTQVLVLDDRQPFTQSEGVPAVRDDHFLPVRFSAHLLLLLPRDQGWADSPSRADQQPLSRIRQNLRLITFDFQPAPALLSFPDLDADAISMAPSPNPSTSPLNPLLFRSVTKTVKRIPHSSRHLATNELAAMLNGISTTNDVESWERLFRFPSRCFRASRRGGHRRSLASELNQQLRDEADPTSRPPGRSMKSRRDPLNTLATQVATKLEGDYKGAAIRPACSEVSIAYPHEEETMAALKAKHPPPHPDTQISPPLDDPKLSTISDHDVAKAIHSFPNGSAGGPDGLRPQHLKDLVSASAEGCGKELLAITTFTSC